MEEQSVSMILMVVLGLVSLAFFGVYIWSVIWSYADAEKRGKSGCLVALLVAFASWPLGLLIWFVARPDERGRRS